MSVKHGIDVYLDDRWVFIETQTREDADLLQQLSRDRLPSRRSIQTDEGITITVHATE